MRATLASVFVAGFFAGCACAPAAPARAPAVAAPAPGFALVSAPELVAPGIVSTEHTEIRLAIGPDGQTMLWGSTDRPGGPGGWDIWMSQRMGPPVAVSFDSPANDFDPAFSPDGAFVYFFSNREGGLGGDDLYRVPVRDGGFGEVEHLGASVNTPGNEWAPAITADGALLFATDGRGGAGGHDLFLAAADGAGWAAPQPLPGAINTAADELDATFLSDDATIVFSRSADVEAQPILLHVAQRGTDGYDAGAPLADTVNVADGATLGPSLDPADPAVLIFTGRRAEHSAGRLDLYRVRYRL